MIVRRWVGVCAVIASGFAACSDPNEAGAGDRGDGGAAGTPDSGGSAIDDAGSPGPDDGGGTRAEAGTSGATDAGNTTASDAGRVDAGGGGTPTITVGEINAVPRTPYAGQSVRLSISLSGGQAPVFWEQTAGPNGRFSSQTGTTVQWSSPGLGTRTTFTVQVRVSTAPAVTKTISFTIDPPTYTQVWNDILQPNCRSCHGYIGDTPAAGYAGLVGANHAATPACTSSGFTKRVVAGNAQQSLLFRKLLNTQPAACGGRMPSAAALPVGQIEAIGAWINMGAPNN